MFVEQTRNFGTNPVENATIKIGRRIDEHPLEAKKGFHERFVGII